jgi:hypothetical protein
MNVIDAADNTVHDYPGGSESLAPRLGMSAAVLRNKVNPNNDRNHLSLSEADQMMAKTGDHRILHALAAQHGYVLHKIDTAQANESVLGVMLSNSAKHGAFFQTLQHALADGLITENEMADLSKGGTAAMESMVVLMNVLRKVTGQRGVTA